MQCQNHLFLQPRYMHMMKLVILTLFLGSFGVIASCPEQQDLDIQTTIMVNGAEAGGNHGFMDIVTISIPHIVNGIPFQSIELTFGEVSEYWIPLATKIKDERVLASITGYPDSIKPFEFWVNYSDGKCVLYQAGSIGSAYNKALKKSDT
jgi:hypothetical protein